MKNRNYKFSWIRAKILFSTLPKNTIKFIVLALNSTERRDTISKFGKII